MMNEKTGEITKSGVQSVMMPRVGFLVGHLHLNGVSSSLRDWGEKVQSGNTHFACIRTQIWIQKWPPSTSWVTHCYLSTVRSEQHFSYGLSIEPFSLVG